MKRQAQRAPTSSQTAHEGVTPYPQKSKAPSYNLTTLKLGYAEYVWVLGVSPGAKLHRAWAARTEPPWETAGAAAHRPETAPALLVSSAETVSFGFVLKEQVAKSLQITANQKAKNPELEMLDCSHYMSQVAAFRITDVTYDF